MLHSESFQFSDQILGTRTCSGFSEFSNSCARISNLWVSSVQTCRRAQAILDFVSFAILSCVRGDLWSSSVQTRRRARVVRDFVSFASIVFVCDNLWSSSVQMCRRAQVIELQLHPASSAYAPTNETKRFPGWIHPQPPVLGALQFLCSDWDRESIK